MHIVTQNSCPSALNFILDGSCCDLWMDLLWRIIPQTNLFGSAYAYVRAAGNNTEKKRLPFRRREKDSYSEYDNHVLNNVKSQQSPPSAGMSPLAQRNFIALPSLCWGDTGGQNPALTPWGHLLSLPPRCTLWLWHSFVVRRHKSLCRRVFVSLDKARKSEKKTIQMPSLKWLSLPPFIMQVGVSFVRTWWYLSF